MGYLDQAKRAAGRLGSSFPGPSAKRGADSSLQPWDPRFQDTVARLAAMGLDQFESQGQPFEVRVPWHPETLWFVPAEADVEWLQREGISRGRIWTAGELANAGFNQAPDSVRLVAPAKLGFSGDVVAVIPRTGVRTAGETHDH